jgi:hypothetical protein
MGIVPIAVLKAAALPRGLANLAIELYVPDTAALADQLTDVPLELTPIKVSCVLVVVVGVPTEVIVKPLIVKLIVAPSVSATTQARGRLAVIFTVAPDRTAAV